MSEFLDDLLNSVLIRLLSAGLILVGVIIVWIAPAAQQMWFPVIAPDSARIISHFVDGDGWTNFRVTFKKNYDCRSSAADTEWFFIDTDGSVGILPWAAATNSHSPSGIVISPALRVDLPVEAVSFFARVLYDCGLPWKVYAVIGPFKLPLPS